jgi:cysteine desulfurase/selenocysteine lyase
MNNIKGFYPALNRKYANKKLIYFDNACSLLKPKCVIDAVSDYYSHLGSCSGGRSDHILSQITEEFCDKAREEVKKFINADSAQEIIWTKNTTEGINLIAQALPFTSEKKEVITFNIEHHSNLLPFHEAQKKGAIKLKILQVKKDGGIDLDGLSKAITQKTALVSIAHSSNVLGVIQPVKEISRIVHGRGAYILVDDAQYIATHQEDVRANDIDFLVFSGHKLGGPSGIGVLYVRNKLHKNLGQHHVGGGTLMSVRLGSDGKLNVKYLPSPKRFEAGVQHYAGIIGLGKAVNFIKHIGYENISRRVSDLTEYLFRELKGINKVGILGDYKEVPRGSLLSFYFNKKKLSLRDFNIFLNHQVKGYVVLVRCGHHCAQPAHQYFGKELSMRLSFFIYNEKKEIGVFLDALKEYLRIN